jgi:hypothetical protein
LDRTYRIDRIRKENPDDPVNPVRKIFMPAVFQDD